MNPIREEYELMTKDISDLTDGCKALRRKNALHGIQVITPKLYPRARSPQMRHINVFRNIYKNKLTFFRVTDRLKRK